MTSLWAILAVVGSVFKVVLVWAVLSAGLWLCWWLCLFVFRLVSAGTAARKAGGKYSSAPTLRQRRGPCRGENRRGHRLGRLLVVNGQVT